jgi:hypothetical protein
VKSEQLGGAEGRRDTFTHFWWLKINKLDSEPRNPRSGKVKRERSVWYAVGWAVVTGAIGGGGIWWITNQIAVNNRSILERAPWPLNTPVPFAVAGGVLTGISVLRSRRRSEALREELRAVAGELGLAYDEGDVVVSPEARPGTPLCAQWSRCQNRLSGTNDGVPAQMFDLTTVSGSGDGTVYRTWTVVAFERTDLPVFSCLPNVWWTKVDRIPMSAVNFDPDVGDSMTRETVAGFQKSYQVCLGERATRSEEEETRRLFRVPLMAALAAQPGWFIQSADGCLVLAHKGIAPGEERATLWREAAELRRAFLARASSARVPIPAAPGMERGREENRRVGRAGGAMAGAVVGFFGSFIAFATLTLNGRGGPNPYAMFAFLPIMIGGLVVGVFVGTSVGRWLADRTYRPAPDGAPALKIARGWVIAGAFIGWAVGLVIGLGMVTVIGKLVPNGWFLPIVFFSPPILFVVLGGIAGHRVGRRWQIRRALEGGRARGVRRGS